MSLLFQTIIGTLILILLILIQVFALILDKADHSHTLKISQLENLDLVKMSRRYTYFTDALHILIAVTSIFHCS